MNAAVVVRIAKLIALFGFFLPWVLFSCSGQEIGTMSGLDVAIGHLKVTNPMNGQVQTQNVGLNLPILLALIATVVGLIIGFTAKDKDGLRGAAAAAVVALAASFFGMMWLKDSPRREAAQQSRSSQASSFEAQIGAASLSAIRIQEQTGYWVTLIALAGAAGVGFLGGSPGGLPAVLGDTPAFGRRPEDDEIEYWDNVDKQDPLALRDYLLRFPLGRFAELARMKLEQLGGREPTSTTEAPAANPPPIPSDEPAPRMNASVTASTYSYDAEPDAPTRKGPPSLVWITGALIAMAVAALILIPDVRNFALNTFTPAADDAAFLEQAGFNAPLQINVQLNQLHDREGQFVRNNNPALIALLLENSFLSVQPYAEAEPWWRFSTTNGSVENGRFTTAIARRVVVSRSDQRRWSENGTNYFAETVSYNVEVADSFQSISPRSVGPFTLRLTAIDDPRAGEWRLQSRDYLGSAGNGNNDEAEQVLSAAIAAGRARLGALNEQVIAAQQAAYIQIEERLRPRLFRNGDVVVAPAIGLEFLRRRVSAGTWIALSDACARESTAGGAWRMARREELNALVSGQDAYDTPDHRIWGETLAYNADASNPRANQLWFNTFYWRGRSQRGTLDEMLSPQTRLRGMDLYVDSVSINESGRIGGWGGSIPETTMREAFRQRSAADDDRLFRRLAATPLDDGGRPTTLCVRVNRAAAQP